MLRNYIKIALRTLQKQKLLALINVLGLSIGIACATLVLLYAGNELSFDRFHKNAHRIFRVYETVKGPGSEDPTFMTNLPMPLGPELVRSFPEIKEFSRLFFEQDEKLLRSKGQIHRVNISFADPQFFSIFSFPLRYGNSYSALSDPENVVLTSSIAKSLFGTENALGQEFEIKIDSSFQTFRVGAVLEDLPANSSIRFDLLASMPIQERTNSGKAAMTDWFRSEYQTYILVDPNTNLQNLEKKLNKFQGAFTEEDQVKLKKSGFIPTYGLQALRSMHTDTKIKDGTTVERSTIWIMISVAAGILIIACINFTTLAIGRSAGRSKEVGIRKVAGAKRKQLVLQFLAEAFLLTILSTFIGIVIANFLLPYFNELSGRELQFSFSNYPELPWLLAGLLIIVGLVAGSYPAILLSGFNPVEVFKSRVRVGGSNWFTQSLVTIQFTISVGLMMSTLVLLKQARYMSEKDLGFKKENVLMIDASETDTKKIYPLFKEEMKKLPGISGIACASEAMGNGEEFGLNVFKFKDRGAMASFNSIDPDFIEVMGMKLIAGRNFRANIPQDSLLSVIINESLAEELGWSVETAVGQPLSGFSGSHHPDPLVIGVVADFNFRPLTEKVTPQLFCPFCNDDRSKFLLRLQAG
ncbi:MAG: ABC transporter permease, partial [Chitinophagales bacterium]